MTRIEMFTLCSTWYIHKIFKQLVYLSLKICVLYIEICLVSVYCSVYLFFFSQVYRWFPWWRRYHINNFAFTSTQSNFIFSIIYYVLVVELSQTTPNDITPIRCRVSIYDSYTNNKVGVGPSLDSFYSFIA